MRSEVLAQDRTTRRLHVLHQICIVALCQPFTSNYCAGQNQHRIYTSVIHCVNPLQVITVQVKRWRDIVQTRSRNVNLKRQLHTRVRRSIGNKRRSRHRPSCPGQSHGGSLQCSSWSGCRLLEQLRDSEANPLRTTNVLLEQESCSVSHRADHNNRTAHAAPSCMSSPPPCPGPPSQASLWSVWSLCAPRGSFSVGSRNAGQRRVCGLVGTFAPQAPCFRYTPGCLVASARCENHPARQSRSFNDATVHDSPKLEAQTTVLRSLGTVSTLRWDDL